MSFKQKMMLLLVAVGIIPMLFVFSVTTYFASNDLEQQAFSKLKAVQEIKSSSIRVYLNRLTTEVHLLSTDPEIINVLEHFDHAYQVAQLNPQRIAEERNALRAFYLKEFLPRLQKNRPSADSSYIDNLLHGLNDKDVWFQYRYLVSNSHPVGEKDKLIHSGKGDEYDQYHQHVQNYLRGIQKEYGFYDIFLINNEGEILYSVFKETDFATSLTHGPYKDSGLAKAYKKVKESQSNQAIMVDFQRYVPSYDNPAAFIASPIYTPKGKLIGVLAAQFPVKDLNVMMGQRSGMGKTGESLLIGPDQLVRTDSYLQPKRYNVTRSFLFPGQSRLDSEAASRALAGQSGIGFLTDYTGKDVLASYAPFKYKDLNWAIVVKKGRDEALASVRSLWKVGGSIFIVTLVVVIVIAIYFTRLVLKPLGAEPIHMQQIARSITKGDLTVTVPPCDRKTVMGTLNEMVQNLRHMVSQITEQTREQHQVAHQLSSVSEQTNQSLHEQAEHITMAATSVTQMSESFREVSENIQRAAGRSNDSKNQIEQSSADVIATSNVLHEVADEFKASAQTVDDLTGEVSRISSALESIQKIADQTNLLALNAAIEAARAGENGRGFAVVADEVRALASNTQRETEQISDIIQSLQHSSKATQTQMQTSVNRAEAMCEQAAQTAENLRSAAESLDEVAQMNENVASASEEQNHVAMEISGNVESLRAAITETEQSMNDIAASSSAIAKSSDNLQNLIKQFKV